MPRHWRRSIGFVAMLCVLLHAGAIMRHVSMVVGSSLAQGELAQALGLICHGSGGQSSASPEGMPDLPAQSANNDCPICAAAASTVAFLAEPSRTTLTRSAVSIRQEMIAEITAPRLSPVCPPSTGPPRIV